MPHISLRRTKQQPAGLAAPDPNAELIERFKAARVEHHRVATQPERAADAAALADLTARIHAHVGDPSVLATAKIVLLSRVPLVGDVDIPEHSTIRVTAKADTMVFHVNRGRAVAEFDALADALIHGGPLKFEGGRPVMMTFDTRKK